MNITSRRIVGASVCLIAASLAIAKTPDCTRPDGWPASMAFVHLKNAGVTDNGRVDFSKVKVVRLASEKIGKDLFRQIHLVKFVEKSGSVIEVITINDASNAECSQSAVDVFVISRRLVDNSLPRDSPMSTTFREY